MSYHDLYGFNEEIEIVKKSVENAVTTSLSGYDSAYYGDYYMLCEDNGYENFRLTYNEIEDEDGKFLKHPTFPEFIVVMSVYSESLDEADRYKESLISKAHAIFLQRESFGFPIS